MTTSEVRELLNLSKSKIFELVRNGKLIRIYKNNYDKKSVLQFKEDQDFRLKNKPNWKY